MRILYVTSSLPHGKKEAFVIPEINELKRRGHEVMIVPTYPRGDVLHGDAEALVKHTASEGLLSPRIAKAAIREVVRGLARAFGALSCLFESRSTNVLLKNLVVYAKGLWLAELARSWRADHMHAHWATVPATMALVAGEVSGIPWSITAHRFDIAEDNLLVAKVRRACFIRAISQRGAREIIGRVGPKAPPPLVIHMGVTVPSADVPQRRHQHEAVPRLVVAANLLEVKGHVYLLEAVRLLSDRSVHVHLDLAGDGPLREALASKVETLGLGEQVTFLGLVAHDELMRQLEEGRWSMLVLPSVVTEAGDKEGIPVALIEAMSYRVPVVATETGGIPELFQGIHGAPLVPPEDPVALAETIERLINDRGLRNRLAEAGRKRVEESFAIERVVGELVERFEGCREPSD
jgi:glycosyltransferase involved in cell wall biosynthesis